VIVKELMSTAMTLLPPSANLSDVLTQMQVNCHSCVLITENSVALGIITERDLLRVFSDQILAPDADAGLLSVQTLMTTEPVSVLENTPFLEALVLSRSRKLRHLPVVNGDGQLVGLVTHTNMADAYVKLLDRQGELESANEQLQALSLEDSVLQIGNRRALDMELALLDAQTRRSYQPFALVMLDVDYFKRYNDHYGHPMGDEALKKVVAAIKGSMRSTDRLYRYGGEEFLLLAPSAVDKAALAVANRARQAVIDMALSHAESPQQILTISAGVAWGRGIDCASLINAADKALYQAKESGRNKVCMAD
jgi:diguanylate cyclase (GGDEF)-like protein